MPLEEYVMVFVKWSGKPAVRLAWFLWPFVSGPCFF